MHCAHRSNYCIVLSHNMYKYYMFIKIKIPFMLEFIKITLLSNLQFLKIGDRWKIRHILRWQRNLVIKTQKVKPGFEKRICLIKTKGGVEENHTGHMLGFGLTNSCIRST